jgi:hypothetical protein
MLNNKIKCRLAIYQKKKKKKEERIKDIVINGCFVCRVAPGYSLLNLKGFGF